MLIQIIVFERYSNSNKGSLIMLLLWWICKEIIDSHGSCYECGSQDSRQMFFRVYLCMWHFSSYIVRHVCRWSFIVCGLCLIKLLYRTSKASLPLGYHRNPLKRPIHYVRGPMRAQIKIRPSTVSDLKIQSGFEWYQARLSLVWPLFRVYGLQFQVFSQNKLCYSLHHVRLGCI